MWWFFLIVAAVFALIGAIQISARRELTAAVRQQSRIDARPGVLVATGALCFVASIGAGAVAIYVLIRFG